MKVKGKNKVTDNSAAMSSTTAASSSSKTKPLRLKKLKKAHHDHSSSSSSSSNNSSFSIEELNSQVKGKGKGKGKGKRKNANENQYLVELKELKATIPEWDDFFVNSSQSSEVTREQNWIRLEVLGESLQKKYSWAVPDARALNILKHFSPLVEIGAGLGYWAHLLHEQGVDIKAFDREVLKGKEKQALMWYNVEKGGPKVLKDPLMSKRNLFLCYPDQDGDLGHQCLLKFQGEYVIHVGELIQAGGTISGVPQAPFGRTSGADFQVLLSELFHCVLIAELPRFPFSNDCITVWKRTQFVRGRDTDSMQEEEEEEEVEGSEEKDEDFWASIPREERMSQDNAAPYLSNLLSLP